MKSIIILLTFLLVSTVTYAEAVTKVIPKDKFIEKGTTIGTFDSFEWGDYMHIQIISKGKKVSFFGHRGPISVFEDFQKELKGFKIKVSWEKVSTFIPQDRATHEIVRTTDICSYKEIKFVSKIMKEKVKICEDSTH